MSLLGGTSQDSRCISSPLVKNVIMKEDGVAVKKDCIAIDLSAGKAQQLLTDLADIDSFFEMLNWPVRAVSLEILDQNSAVHAGFLRMSPEQARRDRVLVHSLIKSILLQSLDESVASNPLELEIMTDITAQLALRNHVKPFGQNTKPVTVWSTSTICESQWIPLEYEFVCPLESGKSMAGLSAWGVRPYLLNWFQQAHSAISIAERIQLTKQLFSVWQQKKWPAQAQYKMDTVSEFEDSLKLSWDSVVGSSLQITADFKPFQNLDGVIHSDGFVVRDFNVTKNQRYVWLEKDQWYLPSENTWVRVRFGKRHPTLMQKVMLSCEEPKIGDLIQGKSKRREILYVAICDQTFSQVADLVEKSPYQIARLYPKVKLVVYDRPSLEISLNWGFQKSDQIVERMEKKKLSETQLRLIGLKESNSHGEEGESHQKSENFFSASPRDLQKVSGSLPVIQYIRL